VARARCRPRLRQLREQAEVLLEGQVNAPVFSIDWRPEQGKARWRRMEYK